MFGAALLEEIIYRHRPSGNGWLGFGHFVIAAFFILPFVDPIRYRAVLHIGLFACAGVIVLAEVLR